MDSPILYRLFADIRPDAGLSKAIYLQAAEAIQQLIRNGQLLPGDKLPASRELAAILQLNRITVTRAFQELEMQGWLESHVGRGTFVASHLPEMQPRLLKERKRTDPLLTAGFRIATPPHLAGYFSAVSTRLHLDDGFPDPRLGPLKELSRAYRNQLVRSGLYSKFGSYHHPAGAPGLRRALSAYLNQSRRLSTTEGNILTVRGTVMGINLVCNGLLEKGDVVVAGIPGWGRAEANFIHAGARLMGIPVDEHGLSVDSLRKICRRRKVRMVYVTPHHHYPTTVSLRMDRRLELLQLSQEYGFIIFEDDYDFDFHYSLRPLMPLASADEQGMVIYCGSFSKSFSPAFRLGYLVASENVITHLSKVRLILDRQGDHILENAMAELLDDGTLQRSLRKTLSVYRERRDFFCQALQNELGNRLRFSVPEGGMTVWTNFDKKINLEKLALEARKKELYISDGKVHQYPGFRENATRLGFASSSLDELAESVAVLKKVMAYRI